MSSVIMSSLMLSLEVAQFSHPGSDIYIGVLVGEDGSVIVV